MIPLHDLILLSLALFCIGWAGILIRRNMLILFMSIELMLNAANLAFVSFARYRGMDGQVVTLFVMALAASEAVVGLAILIVIFRYRKSVRVDDFTSLHG